MVQPRDPEPEHHYPPDMSVDPLDRLAAEAGVDEAVRRLGHQAWLRRRAEESASLSGLLADLAERQDPVELLLVGGGRRHGRIETVGSDLVGLRLDDRRHLQAQGNHLTFKTTKPQQSKQTPATKTSKSSRQAHNAPAQTGQAPESTA